MALGEVISAFGEFVAGIIKIATNAIADHIALTVVLILVGAVLMSFKQHSRG